MELLNFLKVLYRHRLVLILIPLLAVIVTYFLVRHMPNQHISQSRVATGIVDATEQGSLGRPAVQDIRVSQEFDNLIQMMTLKRIVNQVSYTLIIHDLTNAAPFRKKSSLVEDLNEEAVRHALNVYREKYKQMADLSLWNADEKGLHKVLQSMRYDYTSLTRALRVYRAGNSDFITVEFESENPELSAFVVNTLCEEFIRYYTAIVRENQYKSMNYLDSMLHYKEGLMNTRIAELKNYKIRNRVLNLNEQAKSLYGQISDFETRRELAKKDVAAYEAAARNIDSKFDPSDRRYMESALRDINMEIERTKAELKDLNQAYITSNFDTAYRRQIDALQHRLTSQINEASDRYAYNPLVAKENLVTQKLSLETSRELAENSIDVLNQELVRLNKKLDQLVPNEAEIQAYENDIDILSREYIELLAKFNQASMESGYSVNLRQVEVAMPGSPMPSKKMLLVILSGIISFVFCAVVLFVLYMLDNAIRDVQILANVTDLPVLGHLNLLRTPIEDFSKLWEHSPGGQQQVFKDLLRAIRFELERDLDTGKIVAITSLKPGEGKTFLTVSLAYAFRHVNRRVLIIDGNFNHPSISEGVHTSQSLEQFLTQPDEADLAPDRLQVIGNTGGDVSLLELADHTTILHKLELLKQQYDLVLIETADLTKMNVAKEWMEYADRVVCVFEYGNSLDTDGKAELVTFKNMGPRFSGWVLNKFEREGGRREARFKKRKRVI